ncbi:probable receptor-like protein kinase at5g24010 [Phtheirospermum japonicum]|uniref:Probable receptor-like protein kinase at5g24010 n=1 Tax=Phtheirospermum japonicum TaxID=374723 RepID=A0A830DNK2_9LAMI|nr:probable receptor-like protein kinase at5g24010 [Phtheirospermum japonicum]
MATPKVSSSSSFSLILSLLSFISAASAFIPADYYLINCGSRAAETLDSDHRVFAGDDSRFLTSTRTIKIESADSPPVSSSHLYRTARAFDRPAHYVFPIRDRGTHHLVRLHFQPLQNNCHNLYEAEFHVVANGFLLLRNYRIPKTENFPVIKEFTIPILADELKITLMPSEKSKFGFVSAIEVISAPLDLIADVAQLVDFEKNERIVGLLRNGFETVHRLNVGGFKVTPFNDSLWRTWVPDDEHLTSSDGSQIIHFGGRIKYRKGGATREVGPDNVYNTARVIKGSGNSIPNSNMTWSFQVEKGYKYMVRMHFCDIASVATGMLYFNVYVNGNLAYENLDMSDVTNWLLASPFYADFVVGGENSGNLVVSVGPSNMSLPHGVDAILNGIEIWKLNNSMGSFDGEVCADFVRTSWRKGHTAVMIPLVAAILLLLSVSVFIRWRRNNNSSVGWSRLPLDVSEAHLKCGDRLSSVKA